MNDKLRAAHDKLQEAVAEIVTGEDWHRMLRTAAKFHKYSFNNQLLIFVQRPDATRVAGFNRWKSLGRTVKKGEKGIQILAPCKYKIDPASDGPTAASLGGKSKIEGTSDSAVEVAAPSAQRGDRPKTEILRGFRVVHVFDVSQTEGEDLDLNLVRPELLNGEAPDGLWDALVSQATDSGYTVVRTKRGSANGYCDFVASEVGIDPNLPDLQAVKTLIHELSHARLHSDGATSREVAEVEVESAAFIVLDALGLQSDSYSFPYVARWANGEVELVKQTAERAIGCAKAILEGLASAVEVATLSYS